MLKINHGAEYNISVSGLCSSLKRYLICGNFEQFLLYFKHKIRDKNSEVAMAYFNKFFSISPTSLTQPLLNERDLEAGFPSPSQGAAENAAFIDELPTRRSVATEDSKKPPSLFIAPAASAAAKLLRLAMARGGDIETGIVHPAAPPPSFPISPFDAEPRITPPDGFPPAFPGGPFDAEFEIDPGTKKSQNCRNSCTAAFGVTLHVAFQFSTNYFLFTDVFKYAEIPTAIVCLLFSMATLLFNRVKNGKKLTQIALQPGWESALRSNNPLRWGCLCGCGAAEAERISQEGTIARASWVRTCGSAAALYLLVQKGFTAVSPGFESTTEGKAIIWTLTVIGSCILHINSFLQTQVAKPQSMSRARTRGQRCVPYICAIPQAIIMNAQYFTGSAKLGALLSTYLAATAYGTNFSSDDPIITLTRSLFFTFSGILFLTSVKSGTNYRYKHDWFDVLFSDTRVNISPVSCGSKEVGHSPGRCGACLEANIYHYGEMFMTGVTSLWTALTTVAGPLRFLYMNQILLSVISDGTIGWLVLGSAGFYALTALPAFAKPIMKSKHKNRQNRAIQNDNGAESHSDSEEPFGTVPVE
jgi:hypothetical protein